MRTNCFGVMALLLMGCQRKPPEASKPIQSIDKLEDKTVTDLGEGKSQVGGVTFKGAKLEVETQEDSLSQTEEQVKKDIYNGVEQYWEPLAEVKDLLKIYEQFIEYEYGVNDERNTLYLTEDKKEVFHQLTGSAYDIVVAERNYNEVSAGIFIAGATELRYAEMWNRYPTPEYLEHNAQILFGEQVRDTVRHLTSEGQDKLERLISHYERSRVSGDFTELALQELQWRFPMGYPQPIPAQVQSPLPIFIEYREVFALSPFVDTPQWSSVYEKQMLEIQRLSNGQQVVDTVRLKCVDSLKVYTLLGRAPLELCVMEQLAKQEILYIHYPGSKLPVKMTEAHKIVFKALKKTVEGIESWEDTEYGRFWKKEATLRLRALQYDKMKAMRQERRDADLIDLDISLWDFTTEEVMDDSTATILDSHVAQLERELKILRYDIAKLSEQGVGNQARQLFVIFPQRLQEWEFFAQACLFAFPENHQVRIRMELALLETYTDLLSALDASVTDVTKSSVDRWKTMIVPFTDGLAMILDGQEGLTDEQRNRLEMIKNPPIEVLLPQPNP